MAKRTGEVVLAGFIGVGILDQIEELIAAVFLSIFYGGDRSGKVNADFRAL